MAILVSEIVNAARGLLQDRRTPFRYSDQDLIGYTADAVEEAYRTRPDLFAANSLTAPVPVAALGDTVPLPNFLRPQVVNYVVGRAELREDKHSQDSRALAMVQAFTAALVGRAG
jgi:hypothetical protein